ncbi:MAG TPA: hypothetical protein VH325_03260, partial [Bryobacteraceae bacterium]|nr:hypothetical protein [Bryobacteraceae bacterium]
LKSAKGADARRQARKELVYPLGGAPDSVPVLREFRRSAKGAQDEAAFGDVVRDMTTNSPVLDGALRPRPFCARF